MKWTLLVFGLLIFSCSTKTILEESEISSKPNIVFIFTDDQKWNAVHALGNQNIHTPNIDRLVDGAFVFNNAYCFGGNVGAVCITSRNMVMSGKTFFRFEEDCTNIAAKGEKPRRSCYTNPSWPTIPKALKAAGYETYFREKSGSANNPVVRSQFDHFADIHQVNSLKTGRPSKLIIDDAVTFISKERNQEKPFYMYLGIPAPHDPRWSLKQFRDLYNKEEMELPENYAPVHPWNIGDMTIRDECLEKWPRSKESIKRHLYDYYSTITAMDYDFGRLIDVLEEQGLTENTIILFSSDQGLAIGDHGLMGKQNIYEGTMKVPFFIKGPGISEGKSDALVYLHDIFPTLCEFAQSDIPDGLDGKSIKNIVDGREKSVRENLMLAYRNYQRSIRNERFKLIHFPKINKTLLFDLDEDKNELINLADDISYDKIKKQLFDLLEIELKLAGDTISLFPEQIQAAEFIYPKEKLSTAYPSGGLAPEDPSINKLQN